MNRWWVKISDQIAANWNTFISLGYSQKMMYKRNKVLFHQGELGNGFYYLKEGKVKISVISDDGHERDFDYVTPGELIGVQGLLNDPYTYSAKAVEASEVYFFSNHMFNQLCSKIPEASNVLTTSLISKVQILVESISLFSAPAEYRLAHFLHKLYIKRNDPKIKISRTSLGHYIGTSRKTIYQIIRQLEQDGLLKINKGYIHLLDIKKIEDFLESFH